MVDDHETSEERGWVERFRATGDHGSFDRLYRRHRLAIFAVCRHYLKDRDAAEDACHDTFLRAWERSDSLQGNSFLPWVRRIAVNLCLNRIRHRSVGRRLEPILADRETTPAGSEHRTIARQQLEICARIVSALPAHQRRVFLLRHAEGLSPREIVEATDYDADRVRSYLQNARRNFQIAWKRAEAQRN